MTRLYPVRADSAGQCSGGLKPSLSAYLELTGLLPLITERSLESASNLQPHAQCSEAALLTCFLMFIMISHTHSIRRLLISCESSPLLSAQNQVTASPKQTIRHYVEATYTKERLKKHHQPYETCQEASTPLKCNTAGDQVNQQVLLATCKAP